MNAYTFSDEKCNQDDYRFAQKFLLKSLIDNFSIHVIDHILCVTLKKDQTLFELSDKYRRRIQNSKRDSRPCQINPCQFWIMLTISSLIWPNLRFGQYGLSFSRIHDRGDYTFSNTILMPQRLNSQYARSREQYTKSIDHMLFSTGITRLHHILIWQQQIIYAKKAKPILAKKLLIEIEPFLKES
jgi:hypothetical protein